MSSSSSFHQSDVAKVSIRNKQRYVPKSSGMNKNPDNNTRPIPSLSTSLRASSSLKDKSGDFSGNFVNYLPQDEGVASGLGADAGGLDATESQHVVDILNEQLSRLLKMSSRDFWREVARNDSLFEFLDSYLQFRHRWYDFPHHGTKGMVAGVVVGEIDLCRRVFMILFRLSFSGDPGATANDYLSIKEHTALLQEKKMLDLPKLLDICAIYGHDNRELTKSLVKNAMKAQPKLLDNLSAVVSHFLSIAHRMHQRCCSSLEALMSSGGHMDRGCWQLYQDFLAVMDFINDAVVTLDAFADAFQDAVLYFSISFDMSYGSEELLNTLAKLHDSLLPSLHHGLTLVSNSTSDALQNISCVELHTVALSFKMLSMKIVNLGWKVLEFCYLRDEPLDDSHLPTTAKMFPAKVEDPGIRGDIIIQTLKQIKGEALYDFHKNSIGGTFLQNIEENYKILSRIGSLRDHGWIFLEEDQFQYLEQIATPLSNKSWEKEFRAPVSSQKNKICMDEDAIIMESKISQIRDIFPDYGKGFLSACLDIYNHNPEEVIQRILEGTLHLDLLSMDTSLEQIPQAKPSHNTTDKGKGLLIIESQHHSGTALPDKKEIMHSPSSTYGRFTRKPDEVPPDSKLLDSKPGKDAIRSNVLAAELEYDDEYDDSFDDLGLSIVESGFEEPENLRDSISSRPGKSLVSENASSSQNSGSRWSLQKKPQFFVKDGKNYSYKVPGSVEVSNVHEAAAVVQAQEEMIHGLGRGGNIPVRSVKTVMDVEEQDDGLSEAVEISGRGNSSYGGRGGGRRGGGSGRNHNRKDRAMKKHFSGLGGY